MRGRVQARPRCQGQLAKNCRVDRWARAIAGNTLLVLRTSLPQETGALQFKTVVVSDWFRSKQGAQSPVDGSQRVGDASVLDFSDGLDAVRRRRTRELDMSHVTQVRLVTTHNVAASNRRLGPSSFRTAIYWSRDSTRALQGNDKQPSVPSHPRVRASKMATPSLCH